MGLYSDRAAQLGAMIREAGRKSEAERCRDRNGAERGPTTRETAEQALDRMAADGWRPAPISSSLRANLGIPDPDHPAMEKAG